MITTPLNKILFYDVETVPAAESPGKLSDALYMYWSKRMIKHNESNPHNFYAILNDYYNDNAALEPEFGKVVCISYGYFELPTKPEPDERMKTFKVRSICGPDEVAILMEFKGHLQAFRNNNFVLGGHNIKEFDNPFLAKRYLLNRIKIPALLNNYGKKPWEIFDIDTMEIWKMGSFKARYAGLELLAAVFGLPSPKESVNGSMVGGLFATGEYETIANYCAGDVVTAARVVQMINGEDFVTDDKIMHV